MAEVHLRWLLNVLLKIQLWFPPSFRDITNVCEDYGTSWILAWISSDCCLVPIAVEHQNWNNHLGEKSDCYNFLWLWHSWKNPYFIARLDRQAQLCTFCIKVKRNADIPDINEASLLPTASILLWESGKWEHHCSQKKARLGRQNVTTMYFDKRAKRRH